MLLPRTGGRVFVVRDLKKLARTTEMISQEIRYEYVLGYTPPNRQNDGKFRRVHINIKPSVGLGLRVSHRSGYVAPLR
jgi:Ca-activated chloride channel family protein